MSHFAFTSQNTFLRCAPLTASHRFGIAGLPWDGAVSHRPGARFGPRAIRESSHMLCDGAHPYFDVALDDSLGDAGDLVLPHTSLSAAREAVQSQALALVRGHHMAWLGGDHSLTLSLLRVYREVLGRPLAVVHVDAHCDTWPTHFGEPSGHGTWVYEAVREGLVLPDCLVQIGIRSAAQREARDFVAQGGGRVYTAREMRGVESTAQIDALALQIEQRFRAHQDVPVYLSMDIDGLDPAYAPGTGTPEPGGLSTNQVLGLIEALAPMNFVGMDCVEVAPAYDHAELTSNAAATLVWSYLCGQARRQLGLAMDSIGDATPDQ
jgi:agmatinase